MRKFCGNVYVIFLLLAEICIAEQGFGLGKYYSKSRKLELREGVRSMFQHAYDGYLRYASNYDELRPLTCDGHDTWGSYSLTLIDALDTLATMGNFSEFRRVAALLETKMNFDKDINVSVFETNIRIVGGLLSAHLLSKRANMELTKGWPCEGPLLRLAEDVAKRLLPAFDTATGMPYGTVNLRYGVPKGETTITCTAGVGTFLVEFGTLSRLTGNSIYEEVALNAIYALWERRSPIGLFGNHIDVQSGRWTALDSGIGAGVDSFFEYLVKGAMLLNRPELLKLFHEARGPIDKFLRKDDWYIWAGMNKGHVTLPVFQSLESFWPGILGMIGDHEPALRTMKNYISVWNQYGFLPEFYNIPAGEAAANREVYPLRPELIESAMYLYRATKNQLMLEFGEHVLETLEFSAKTKCGYATIRNVVTHEKENRMESFFLAETTKYLYLLFDEDNFLHNNGANGERIETISPDKSKDNGECIVHAGAYIFNTEAHPMDMSALYCCHDINEDIYENLDLNVYRDKSFMQAERNERQFEPTPCSTGDTHTFAKQTSKDFVDIDGNDNGDDIAEDDDDEGNDEVGKPQEQNARVSLSVDIQVYDEENNPAADMLIENFERIRSERIFQSSDTEYRSASQRNQLTVNDLQDFFDQQRQSFDTADDALAFVRKFMRNFTMDVAFIRGLRILDNNITYTLGIGVQNEYESRMRTLWELYDLQQRYAANAALIKSLGLLNFQDDSPEQLPLADILDVLDHKPHSKQKQHYNGSVLDAIHIREALHDARLGYEFSLVNTTAMQEFLRRIYLSGTSEQKLNYKPLLEADELETLTLTALSPVEERQLFVYTRRIVDFKKRMTDTVERLQTLMQEKPTITLTAAPTDNLALAEKHVPPRTPTAQQEAQLHLQSQSSTVANPDKPPESSNKTRSVHELATAETQELADKASDIKDAAKSNSVWQQLVQTILRQTGTVTRLEFNDDVLLKKTRKSLQKYTVAEQTQYALFTCRRASFIENFAYRDFFPTTSRTAS